MIREKKRRTINTTNDDNKLVRDSKCRIIAEIGNPTVITKVRGMSFIEIESFTCACSCSHIQIFEDSTIRNQNQNSDQYWVYITTTRINATEKDIDAQMDLYFA